MKRVAWWLVLGFVAVLAVFAQFDRAADRNPALMFAVPAPLRSVSQAPATMLAMAGSDAKTARTEARRLVRRRPMPAEHLFLLAVADLKAGDADGYSRAFVRATERGWRARPVQEAAARAALAKGDAPAAANRIAALWAMDSSDPAIAELTRALLANDAGVTAFAAKLAGTRVWQDHFLQRAADLAPPGVLRKLVSQAEREGAQFDRALLSALPAESADGYESGARPPG